MKINRVLLLASVPVLAAFFMSPALAADLKPAAKQTQTFPAIRVTQVKERKLTDRVIVTGSIEAVEEVYVQPQVDALRIEKLLADVGDRIKAGDVLATLSSDSLELQKNQLEANLAKNEAMSAQQQAALAEANANEAEAKRQADRAAKLVATGAVAQSQVDQTKSTLDVSIARINSAKQSLIANAADHKALEAQIKDLELKLARTDVKSPVSGIISVRNARVGAIAVGSGQPLFTVIRDGAIEMKADVAENDILKLEPGQKVIMTVAGLRQPIKGEVRSIDPLIDGTTRLGTAKFLVKEPEKAKIGMYASAEVTISVHSAAALPLTAITAEQDGMYARKIENDVVKMIPVETGIQDGDFIEITKGLKIGDVVVEKAGAFVRDGDRVEPVMDDKTASN